MWPRRSLVGLVDRPLPHLPHDAPEHRIDARGCGIAAACHAAPLGVQRGEVLREPFAQPLLVIRAPADRLTPPLVGELVREEEVRIVFERGGIVPRKKERRHRCRFVEHREVAGTMPAGQIAFDERDREARIRIVAEKRLVKLRDLQRAIGHLASAFRVAGIGFDRHL